MPQKVVIKIRKAKHAGGAPGIGAMGCCVPGFAVGQLHHVHRHRHRAGRPDRMRSALDTLEQMYEDLFGGE